MFVKRLFNNMNMKNENLQLLLSDSSTQSDFEQIPPAAPKRRRVRRRFRVRQEPNESFRESVIGEGTCKCCYRLSNISKWIAIFILVCWIAILTSISLVVYEQLHRLSYDVQQAVASSQGVPEALQKSHSVTKQLQENQTSLTMQLQRLNGQLELYNKQVSEIKQSLNDVQNTLKENPEFVSVPGTLDTLKSQAAKFGSEIQDLTATVAALKSQNVQCADTSRQLVQNITRIDVLLGEVKNMTEMNKTPAIIDDGVFDGKLNALTLQTFANISQVNQTLNEHLKWLAEDQKKDHKIIENLQEMNQSVTARLELLEKTCNEYFHVNDNMKNALTNLTNQVLRIQTEVDDVNVKLSSEVKLSSKLSDEVMIAPKDNPSQKRFATTLPQWVSSSTKRPNSNGASQK